MTLMLADDDIEVIEMLRGLLDWTQYGYEQVIVAAGGPEALEAAGDSRVDLLITDIGMPVVDGYELSRSIKEKNPDVKIIFLTCHEDFDHARQAITVGADEYLLKYSLTEKSLTEAVLAIESKRRKAYPTPTEDSRQEGAPGGDGNPCRERLAVSSNEDINQVLRYIDENLDRKISLQSAADHIFKNSSYLSRLFKQHIGMSFTDYLIRQRIEKATSLLANPGLTAEEVGKQIGIDNVSYFYQFYKRETGKTPRGGTD